MFDKSFLSTEAGKYYYDLIRQSVNQDIDDQHLSFSDGEKNWYISEKANALRASLFNVDEYWKANKQYQELIELTSDMSRVINPDDLNSSLGLLSVEGLESPTKRG